MMLFKKKLFTGSSNIDWKRQKLSNRAISMTWRTRINSGEKFAHAPTRNAQLTRCENGVLKISENFHVSHDVHCMNKSHSNFLKHVYVKFSHKCVSLTRMTQFCLWPSRAHVLPCFIFHCWPSNFIRSCNQYTKKIYFQVTVNLYRETLKKNFSTLKMEHFLLFKIWLPWKFHSLSSQ